MKKLIIICLLLASCRSFKEKKSVAFFKEWRSETELLLDKTKPKTPLEKDINELLTLEECSKYKQSIKYFNKLEYKIYPEKIKVSKYINSPKDFFDTDYSDETVFVDSTFKITIDCGQLKTLILNEKFKEELPKKKLFYGFGSSYSGTNKENAKVILEKRGKKSHYRLSEIPTRIEFNQTSDTAVVYISTIFTYTGNRYIRANEEWQFDTELFELNMCNTERKHNEWKYDKELYEFTE